MAVRLLLALILGIFNNEHKCSRFVNTCATNNGSLGSGVKAEFSSFFHLCGLPECPIQVNMSEEQAAAQSSPPQEKAPGKREKSRWEVFISWFIWLFGLWLIYKFVWPWLVPYIFPHHEEAKSALQKVIEAK